MSDEKHIDDGGPAFPVPMIPCDREGGYTEVRYQGMTLRQWYAGQALNGILSQSPGSLFGHRNIWKACLNNTDTEDEWFSETARVACKIADALIAELKKGTQ